MEEPINSYEQERRGKSQKLRELGVDPYGQTTTGIEPLADVKARYTTDMGHDSGPSVKVAGRVMLERRFGKLAFLTLRDETGDLQVALDKKRLSEHDWNAQQHIDLADLIVIEGTLGTTKTGEVTVWAKSVSMAAKALAPPPAKWEGLSDVELRYRQRYVDMWANPNVLRVLKKRMRIVDEVRSYMRQRGFLEVETPMMQPMAGGAAAKPFATHHNALDIPLYLRIGKCSSSTATFATRASARGTIPSSPCSRLTRRLARGKPWPTSSRVWSVMWLKRCWARCKSSTRTTPARSRARLT
jgi:lysyl-tRNA synthetase class 2